MNFHWPSFLIGYGAGVATTLAAQRLRPVLTELAAAGFDLFEAAAARFAMSREDIDDILAEAKARTRPQAGPTPKPAASAKGKSRRRSASSRMNGRPTAAPA